MSWLEAFRRALDQAEAEMKAEIGERQHKVLRQALLLYGSATAEVSE
jgi:Sec-independent protein translocase protein TatA